MNENVFYLARLVALVGWSVVLRALQHS